MNRTLGVIGVLAGLALIAAGQDWMFTKAAARQVKAQSSHAAARPAVTVAATEGSDCICSSPAEFFGLAAYMKAHLEAFQKFGPASDEGNGERHLRCVEQTTISEGEPS